MPVPQWTRIWVEDPSTVYCPPFRTYVLDTVYYQQMTEPNVTSIPPCCISQRKYFLVPAVNQNLVNSL